MLTGKSALREARRLTGRPREVAVPRPACSSPRDGDALAVRSEIVAGAGGPVLDQRPAGDVQHQRLASRPVSLRSLAVAAATPSIVPAVPKGREVPQVTVGDQNYLSPVPAVSAIGAAARHVGLPAKAYAAVAAGPGLDFNRDLVVHRT